ncbi:Gfo/Idh/MocA family oxidoreductase [Streptomonospora sp. S1-112]|uniref:Gfo/Idh/MocA family oxidoreductase n=1 Tax=Streptomonospora mangrovi TaxID=2883123 RepID=A0A9X3NRC9_9ACTN|nr:Gfo/Idh/MocA family oxidoreductase [Streptomonospora mangrovi]MDA0567775.1 Gfo/Idh/MocA family oxidoreductase [Streptomonospora mangrovi]
MDNGRGTGGDLRFGVLGCADVAVRRLLPALARTPGVRLARTASRTPDKAGKVAAEFGGATAPDYTALLAAADVDAVYVPLPAALHARWIEAALRAGKHVLAEKPLTTSARDTERLHALALERGLVLRENYTFLHHRLHDRVAELIAEGAVGEPRLFRSAFAIPARPPGDIRLRPELGGGALLDTAGYPLRAAVRFLGTGLEVAGAVLDSGGAAVDLGGGALLRAPGGVVAQCSFGLDHAYTSHYHVVGSAGALSVEHVFTPPADRVSRIEITGPAGTRTEEVPADDQWANAVAAFARAVRAGEAGTTAQTRAQARLVGEVAAAAQRDTGPAPAPRTDPTHP